MKNGQIPIKEIGYNLLPSLLLVLFTGYVFCYANLKDRVGDMMLLYMLLLALPRFYYNKKNSDITSFLWLLFSIYTGIALASFFFEASKYIHPSWTISTLPRFVFSGIIVLSFQDLSTRESALFSWVLAATCLLLATGYILQSNGVEVQQALEPFSPFSMAHSTVNSKWHWKNYAFWQVFLAWGVAAFFWRESVSKSILAILMIAISCYALFVSPLKGILAESTILAMASGLIFFILAHIPGTLFRFFLFSSIYCLLIFLPIVWTVVAPVKPVLKEMLAKFGGEVGFAINIRVEIMDACAQLVRQKLFFGYGGGSTTFLRVPDGMLESWPGNALPGGHPHNLGFFFLLEYGLVGWLFLTLILFLFFQFVFYCMRGQRQEPAVWAILASGGVLFTLSYSIWHADVVLMYAMFLSLIVARCNIEKVSFQSVISYTMIKYVLVVLLFLAIVGYAVCG